MNPDRSCSVFLLCASGDETGEGVNSTCGCYAVQCCTVGIGLMQLVQCKNKVTQERYG